MTTMKSAASLATAWIALATCGAPVHANLVFSLGGTIGVPTSSDTEGLQNATYTISFTAQSATYVTDSIYGSVGLPSTAPATLTISGSTVPANNGAFSTYTSVVIFPCFTGPQAQVITDYNNYPFLSFLLPSGKSATFSFSTPPATAHPAAGDVPALTDFSTALQTTRVSVDAFNVPSEFYANTSATLSITGVPEASSFWAVGAALAVTAVVGARRRRKVKPLSL